MAAAAQRLAALAEEMQEVVGRFTLEDKPPVSEAKARARFAQAA
jgi:hypothetical protein